MKAKHFAVAVFVVFAILSAAAQSNPQKSFEAMKSLAGNWAGKTTMGDPVEVPIASLQVVPHFSAKFNRA